MACCDGYQLPLPWVLSVFPESLCANQQCSLILLKILDPLPQAVFGDLYFELHQEKKEVYVVTAVDESAWPNGEGEIRFGINYDKLDQYSGDTQFREEFIDAVSAYERIRRQIDAQLDKIKEKQFVGNNEIFSTDLLIQLLEQIPKPLRLEERRLRQFMESFTGRRSLKVGDVVKVPCLIPHSLQHGVRTVEFQTPVYERLIVSFAQKVLTQDNWDTERAVGLMSLEHQEQGDIDTLLDEDGVLIDRIVDFDDFDVIRVVLNKKAQWFLESPQAYSLCMGVEGSFIVGSSPVVPEQAILLTRAWPGEQISNDSDSRVSFLLANPKKH